MRNPLVFYSAQTLEPWDFDTPLHRGIGGSETSHVELVNRIGAGESTNFPVLSFSPTGRGDVFDGAHDRYWRDSGDENLVSHTLKAHEATWVVYRDPEFFSRKILPAHNIYWFIAQDVEYALTEEQAKRIDRYVCLCPEHASYTEKRFPFLRGKICLSSNGVRRDVIERIERDVPISRNPKKLIYASSPDRGLQVILENWFRIREAVPGAELTVCYGFENMNKIAEVRPELSALRQSLEGLLEQPGITWKGRLNQVELYNEWFSAGIWWYPTNWPETSCITCMDAQACGAVPVCSDYWALKQNVFHGFKYPGLPQKDQYLRLRMVHDVIGLLQNPEEQDRIRFGAGESQGMMAEARTVFDWDKFASQFAFWHKQDWRRREERNAT